MAYFLHDGGFGSGGIFGCPDSRAAYNDGLAALKLTLEGDLLRCLLLLGGAHSKSSVIPSSVVGEKI